MSLLMDIGGFALMGLFASFFAVFGEDIERRFWGTVFIKGFWGSCAFVCFYAVVYGITHRGAA